jgi:prepilin peptidase CpaA
MSGFPIAHLSLLGIGLICAAIWDITRRRVPNAVSAFVFMTGVGINWFDHGFLVAMSGLAAAVVTILAFYVPWKAGGIGGGDVKLAAAVATWIGLSHFLWFLLVTVAAGGIVAAVCYVFARAGTRAEVRANLILAGLHGDLPPVPSHRLGHISVPYAVAITVGAAVALLVR